MIDVRWRGFSHEQIYAMVMAGPGHRASLDAQILWPQVEQRLAAIDQALQTETARIAGGWEGPAAEATRRGLSPLADWATQAVRGAQHTADALNVQAEHVATMRNSVPPPVVGLPEDPPQSLNDPGLDPYFLEDWYEADATRTELAEQAVHVMETYTTNSAANKPHMYPFAPPPAVTAEAVSSVAPASVGGAGVPIGAGAGTEPWSGGTAPPTDGGAPGRGGGAGGVGAAPSPGSLPVPPVGPAGTPGAPGDRAGGTNSPGGTGPGPNGQGGATAPGGPRNPGVVGGPDPTGPSGIPGNPGGPGGPGTRSGTSPRPGSRGPADQPGGGAPRPTTPARPPGPPFQPVVPGVPKPVAPPPSWRSDPIITGHGGERGPYRGSIPEAQPGSPAPGTRGEGGRAETGTSARGATTPAESARTAGSRTATGYPGMMPMTPGGTGGSREHRRPHYLVDDTDAFADDRWFTPPVITPDDPLPG